MQRSKALFVMALVATFSLLGACAGDGTDSRSDPLDANGDSLCDFNGESPPADPPTRIAPSPLPALVPVQLVLGTGVSAPANPRAAWFVFDWLNDRVVTIADIALPSDWAPEQQLSIDAIPTEALGIAANSFRAFGEQPPAGALSASLQLAIYDDRNGDGQMGLSNDYPFHQGSQPADPEDNAAWDAYYSAMQDWDERYGVADFVGLSSPSGASNEVLSLAPVSVVVSEDGTARASVERRECSTYTRGQDSCTACASVLEPAHGATEIRIGWSLP